MASHRCCDGETRPDLLAILSHEEVASPKSDNYIVRVTAACRYGFWEVEIELNFSLVRRKLGEFPGKIYLNWVFCGIGCGHFDFDSISDLELSDSIISKILLNLDIVFLFGSSDGLRHAQCHFALAQQAQIGDFHWSVELDTSLSIICHSVDLWIWLGIKNLVLF